MKKLISVISLGILFFGCAQRDANSLNLMPRASVKVTTSDTRSVNGLIPNSPYVTAPNIIHIIGIGEGVAPIDAVSKPQAIALARRAAIDDAYRNLAEQMYGIKLSAKDRIKDLIAQRTEVKTAVYGIIRGAKLDDEKYKDGIYRVTLTVDLDACVWSNYLTAPSLYQCAR